jgi:hypothetical protein
MQTRLLLVAFAASALVVVSGPFIGEIRAALREALPGQYVPIIAGIVAASVLIVLGVAISRIRTRRMVRYAFIGLALAIGVAYGYLTRTGNIEIDVVEQFHVVEYGFLALLFYGAWCRHPDVRVLLLPLAAGTIVGTVDEWFQWFIPSRVGELRDVLLDVVAVGCGLLVAVGVYPPSRIAWPIERRPRADVACAITVVTVTVAAFMASVHMGHEIRDAEAGSFRSHFTPAQLERLAVVREDAWRRQAPGPMPLISREDQYLTEAGWHIQRRNGLMSERDPGSAWKENLIVEKFFAPVLTFAMPDTRWPPDLKAAAAQAVSADDVYFSHAEPYPIYTWPPMLLWLVVAAIVAGVWLPVRTAASSVEAGAHL